VPSRRAWDRQRQLELLGWRWHRIWAGDWAADREGEIRRVLSLLQDERGGTADIATPGGVCRRGSVE
jgi:hypothetical protein